MNTTAEGAALARPVRTSPERFAAFAWGVLAFNIAVVLWGAYVRATGSGAGCGGHWPLCNGDVLPRAPRVETVIEFTHRLSSGLALLSVVALSVRARRAFPRGHRVRPAAALALTFMIAEALLGAALVLFGLVDKNASLARVVSVALHLANTQFLLAALTLTAWLAPRPAAPLWPRSSPRLLFVALALVLAVCVTGAVAALGDTLFPPQSVRAGLAQDFSANATLLIQLRVVHPPIAVLTGLFLLYAASTLARLAPAVKRTALALAVLALVQLCAGALNIALLAPVWMQLLHLLLADLVWVTLVLLSLRAAVSLSSAIL